MNYRQRYMRLILVCGSFGLVLTGLAYSYALGSVSQKTFTIVAPCTSAAFMVILFFALRRSKDEPPAVETEVERRKRVTKSIRSHIQMIALLQLGLWSGLWATRDASILPRLIGAAVNICWTAILVRSVLQLRKCVRLLDTQDKAST